MPSVNPEGLAKQAEQLPPEAQSLLGLLVVWTLSPLLGLDRTDHGRRRRSACLQLLDDAFAHAKDPAAMKDLEAVVRTSDELGLPEEPEDESSYRVDFLAALLYAIRTLTERSSQELTWCLLRAGDTIDLGKTEGLISESLQIDGDLMELITAIQAGSTDGAASVTSFKKILQPAYDSLSAAVGRAAP
jgi:hypothetical protein